MDAAIYLRLRLFLVLFLIPCSLSLMSPRRVVQSCKLDESMHRDVTQRTISRFLFIGSLSLLLSSPCKSEVLASCVDQSVEPTAYRIDKLKPTFAYFSFSSSSSLSALSMTSFHTAKIKFGLKALVGSISSANNDHDTNADDGIGSMNDASGDVKDNASAETSFHDVFDSVKDAVVAHNIDSVIALSAAESLTSGFVTGYLPSIAEGLTSGVTAASLANLGETFTTAVVSSSVKETFTSALLSSSLSQFMFNSDAKDNNSTQEGKSGISLGGFTGARGVLKVLNRVAGVPKPVAVLSSALVGSVLSQFSRAIGRSTRKDTDSASISDGEGFTWVSFCADLMQWIVYDSLTEEFSLDRSNGLAIAAPILFGAISAMASYGVTTIPDYKLQFNGSNSILPLRVIGPKPNLRALAKAALQGGTLFLFYEEILVLLKGIVPEEANQAFLFYKIVDEIELEVEDVVEHNSFDVELFEQIAEDVLEDIEGGLGSGIKAMY